MSEKNKKIIKIIVNTVFSCLSVVLIYILTFVSLLSLSLVSHGFYDLYGDEIKDMIYDEIGDDFLDHKESNKRMNGKVTNKVGRNMLLDVDDFTNNNIGTRTNYGLYTTSIGSSGGSTWSYIYAVTTLSKGYYNYSFTVTADNTNLRTGIRIYQDGTSSMWVNTVETISSSKTYKGTIQITSSSLNVRFDLLRNYYGTGYSGNVIWSIMLTESDYDSGYNAGYDTGYDIGYNLGNSDGITTGQNNVINNPNNYDLYTKNQYDDNYTDGYDSGYDVGYEDGYDYATEYLDKISYNQGYTDGYNKGVNASSNSYYMFDDTYLTLGYTRNNGNDYLEYDYYNISIDDNHYFDLTSDYAVLYQEWESDSNHSEDGLTFAYLEDFGSFVSSNYELYITGFNKVEFISEDDNYYTYYVTDPYNLITVNLVDLNITKPVTAINLYSDFTETYFSSNGYKIGFNYLNNYDNGYKSGYNQGFSNGKNDVLNNPNNYDLYDNEELNEAKDLSYTQGYNKGVLEGEGLGERGFLTMFNAILNAPYNILNGLLNFELFGVNLFNLITFIITTGLIIFLFALFKARK